MIRDFVLELVSAPGTGDITLPGVAPTGRLTWASGFVTTQAVFYILDDSTQQEWGVGTLTVGVPSTISRTSVIGNSAGTTAKLNFTDTCRCYPSLPALPAMAAIEGNTGRNLLHNSRLQIQQRGAGPFTAVGVTYTADQWIHNSSHSNGSFSDSTPAQVDAGRTALGDEDALYTYNSIFTGGTGAGDFDIVSQRVEFVRKLAGKRVTISFWAVASAGTPKVALELRQFFGTGGSPSGPVTAIGAQAFTLSTTWTRYYATIDVPTSIGKTFGSNGDDYTDINLWESCGATLNALRASSIGVQSANISYWGFELKIGSAPSAIDRVPLDQERSACQRFYQVGTSNFSGYGIAAQGVALTFPFPVLMRATPTMTQTNSSGNIASFSQTAAPDRTVLIGTVVATGAFQLIANPWQATAEL